MPVVAVKIGTGLAAHQKQSRCILADYLAYPVGTGRGGRAAPVGAVVFAAIPAFEVYPLGNDKLFDVERENGAETVFLSSFEQASQ
jgi:hypothetical protein